MDNQTTNAQPTLVLTTPKLNAQLKEVIKHEEAVAPAAKDLGHHKLLSCLYFILDAFERAQLDFFLVRKTAHEAMTGHELTGDHLDIGVRNNEWASDAKDILFAYFGQEHVEVKRDEPGFITFSWQDVPFTLHLYEECEPLLALIPIAYEYESWKIPNQFARFEKEFDK